MVTANSRGEHLADNILVLVFLTKSCSWKYENFLTFPSFTCKLLNFCKYNLGNAKSDIIE